MQGLRIAPLSPDQLRSSGRPIWRIVRQPAFLIAVASSAVGYAAMILIMTATPLAMTDCGFAFDDTATVIQWHVLAMFLPGFVTGHLIHRFGVLAIIATGAVLILCSLAAGISGISFFHFWTGLALLGLGWNFMFVGGSTLLTETYRIEERAKAQSTNDFIVFSSAAFAAFGSGALQGEFGWIAVNSGALPAVGLILLTVGWMGLRGKTLKTN